jgi:hypothetical protein
MSARPAHAFSPTGCMPARLRRGGAVARHMILAPTAFFLGLAWLSAAVGPTAIVRPAAAADPAVGAGAWLAEEVRGTVSVRTAGEAATRWQPLQPATPIAGQSEIATGSDGIAVLNNGVDHIRLAPNSRLVLPPDQSPGLMTVIRQSLGKIFFEVGHRPDRSFEVDAPYLVVLVKGTQFTVTTNYLGDKVAVTEGTVEVRTATDGGGSGTLITAGQTASVGASGGSIGVESSGKTDGDLSGQGTGDGDPQAHPPQIRKARPPGGDGGGEGGTGGTEGNGGGGEGGDPGSGGDPGNGGDPGGGDPGSGGDPGGGGSGGGCGSGHGHGEHHGHNHGGESGD